MMTEYFGDNGSLELFEKSDLIFIRKGGVLIKQEESGTDMYLLISGALSAVVEILGIEQIVGHIGIGECVGEMALLGNQRRSANIIAQRSCLLLKISQNEFLEANKKNPQVGLNLSKTLIRRLDHQNKGKFKDKLRSRFISLISMNPEIDSSEFAEKFKSYWTGHKKVALVDSSSLPFDNEIQLALKINDLEQFDYVLMYSSLNQLEPALIENSDKTVFIATESDDNTFSKLNYKVSENDELLLAYTNQNISKLEPWFHHFSPEKVYKYKASEKDHLERVIRIVSETPICLVLGGGGAHGLSIVGVAKALYESNVPIDIIGGTSIGSIMAAGLAQDWPFEDIYRKVRADISKNNPLTDYTIPLISLIKGKKMKKVLRKHFNLPIEHCWKNLFIVTANLSRFETEVLNRGPLDKSIACSIAIPGILPPQLHNNSLMIDGGVLNNLPSDIMRKRYPGFVLSIDVISSKKRSIDHQYPINNWQLIKNSITGNRKNYIPNTMSTLMKANTLASAERADEKEAVSDIYLKPRIKKGFLAWKEMDAFVEEGYQTMRNYMEAHDIYKVLHLPDHLRKENSTKI